MMDELQRALGQVIDAIANLRFVQMPEIDRLDRKIELMKIRADLLRTIQFESEAMLERERRGQ
jgi:hypothetical protein